MNRYSIVSVCFILYLLLTNTSCFAAFPVPAKTLTTAVSTPAPIVEKTRTSERPLRLFLENIKNTITGEDSKNSTHLHTHKTGWQGIVAFTCGILGLLTGSLAIVLILAPAAVVFGVIGLNKAYHNNTGLAITGLILGCIEVMVALLLVIVLATTVV